MKMEPQKFLALLKSNTEGSSKTPSLEDMREEFQREGKKAPIAEGVSVSEKELGGVACLCMEPATATKSHIIYLHGGGYAGGSPTSHQGLTSSFVACSGMTLWSLDYRLAPENPFPAAIDDAIAAYGALQEMGVAPDNIIIAGDSAGGGLSVATMLKAKQVGMPMPAGLVLMSPWTNLTLQGWSMENNVDKDFLAAPEMLDIMAGWYVGDTARDNPLVSPCLADLAGLPKMIIHAGADEVLMSDSVLLAERAAGAGVEVTLKIWPEMPHVFQMFGRFLEAAELSIAEIADWASKQVG